MKGLIIGLSLCICLYSSFFYYNCKKNSEKKIIKAINKHTQTEYTENNDTENNNTENIAENNDTKNNTDNITDDNDTENNDTDIKDILNDIIDKVLEDKKPLVTFDDEFEVIH